MIIMIIIMTVITNWIRIMMILPIIVVLWIRITMILIIAIMLIRIIMSGSNNNNNDKWLSDPYQSLQYFLHKEQW